MTDAKTQAVINISASPRYHFTIKPTLLAILMILSHNHYDGLCKSASKPQGFLETADKWAKFMQMDPEIRINHQDLNVLMKICENFSPILNDQQRKEVIAFKELCMRSFHVGEDLSRNWARVVS